VVKGKGEQPSPPLLETLAGDISLAGEF